MILVWMMLATLIASFIKGLCGFADTLVFTSICSFTIDNINISPIELLVQSPGNCVIVWKGRKHLNPRVLLPLCLIVLAGNVPGILLLKNTDAHIVKIIFGIAVIMIGIQMLSQQRHLVQKKPSRLSLIIIGFISGILCGLYGVGALLAAYVGKTTDNIMAFKANLSFVFMVECTFRIIIYSLLKIITLESVKNAIILIPIMFCGINLGLFSSRFLNEKAAKKLVIILLIFTGFALILNNL